METRRHAVDTPGGQLSGRISGPMERPRGLVIALHGGTYDSGYYDTGPGSLLSVGDALGLCVVALDRPGYGAGSAFDPRRLSFSGQTELLGAAVKQLIRDIDPIAGAVLVGHSIGGMLALRVAAEGAAALRGVEVSGIGARWRPGMRETWSSFIGDRPAIEVPADAHAHVMFGPVGTYAPDRRALDAELARPMPMPELMDVVHWAEAFPSVAKDVTVPVSMTFPEHDNIWMTDADARSLAGSLFTRAPSVHLELFAHAGHCIELHKRARSYCLHQLAFVEDCLAL
jgi:pimeloyl-ACP methyl ester carboxylesterase